MSDPHALVLEAGGQRFTFRCDYAVLLKLESLSNWRELLGDAVGLRTFSSLIEIASLFANVPQADIIAASPPVSELQRCVTGAWTLCMEGPEALRRYQEAVAKEAAAPDAGKPMPSPSRWGRALWTRVTKLWSRAFRKLNSGD